MNFQWNGEFSWFCPACECDGSFTAQTQQQVLRRLRDDHAAAVAGYIRSGDMALPCESRSISIIFTVSLDDRTVEGRIPQQKSAGKLHKRHGRRSFAGSDRAACWSARANARLTDDDDAVTCRTCRYVMDRDHASAMRDAEWERSEKLEAAS